MLDTVAGLGLPLAQWQRTGMPCALVPGRSAGQSGIPRGLGVLYGRGSSCREG